MACLTNEHTFGMAFLIIGGGILISSLGLGKDVSSFQSAYPLCFANWTLLLYQYMQATDTDIGNNSIVYFRILSNNVPYVVDRDAGVVTTAGVFTGLSGQVHKVEVEAFDNFGIPPTNRRTAILTVSSIHVHVHVSIHYWQYLLYR